MLHSGRMRRTKRAATKAERLERDGDRLLAKGKATAALKKYRAVEMRVPDRAAIYAKLIAAHAMATREWGPEDLAESLAWEMRRQEVEHPEIRPIHERLSPEWQTITERIHRLVGTEDETVIRQLTEEIAGFGARAVRPLLDMLVTLKGKPRCPT